MDSMPKLEIRSTCKGDWPSLAWVAHCPLESGSIDVLHGQRVETRPDWFCEAVWAGEFSAGNFDETDIVAGTGGRSVDGAVAFVSVSSGSTIGAHVDSTYPDYSDDFDAILKGLHAYKREFNTSLGPVQLVYFNNAGWDGYRPSEQLKPNASQYFSSFDRYHDFLTSAMQAIASNAYDYSAVFLFRLLAS